MDEMTTLTHKIGIFKFTIFTFPSVADGRGVP